MRSLSSAVAAVLVVLLGAQVAHAGTAGIVTDTEQDPRDDSNYFERSQVEYIADRGERNVVQVTRQGTIVTLTDTAGTTAVDPCVQVDPTTVRCELRGRDANGISSRAGALRLGDGNDRASSPRGTAIVAIGESGNDSLTGGASDDHLFGGRGNDLLDGGRGRDRAEGSSGNDRLLMRDGLRDSLSCGRGRDGARADRFDRVLRDCERGRRG